MSSSYSYSGSPSLSSGTYTRSYSANGIPVSTTYTPYNFFNTFGSKTSVNNKLNYAKAGLGISPTSTTFTNTYNPVTNTTSGGNQFRMICTYSSYYARDPYQEYSLVANTISDLYDVHIKNTSSATYIDSAEYESSSWTTSTDTIHGRVLIGTAGNANAVAVSDNNVDINNHVLPSTDNAFSLGTPDKKWLSLYVDTVIADNYIGLPDSSSSGGSSGGSLEFSNSTSYTMSAWSNSSYGSVSSSTIYPYSSLTYNSSSIVSQLMGLVAWRLGGGASSYNKSDSTGSNVGALGIFALRRSSVSYGDIDITCNVICPGSYFDQVEIHSDDLTGDYTTGTSISITTFNYWRDGTWLILSPISNQHSGMSLVLAVQILS